MAEYSELKEKYDSRFTKEQVLELYAIGVTLENTPLEKQRRLYRQLCRVPELIKYLGRKNNSPPELGYYAGGVHSVVLISNYHSRELIKANNLPKIVDKSTHPFQRVHNLIFLRDNIINPHPYVLYKLADDDNINEFRIAKKINKEDEKRLFGIGEDTGIGIQEIKSYGARSLDKLLGQESLFSLELKLNSIHKESLKQYISFHEVIKFSKILFEALEILRKYEIFHRDLGLGNIILEQKGSVKIIDFGIATDTPNSEPKDNRKYGGANDLISLGQIVYTVYTGKNLFNTSILRSSWEIAEEIESYRDDCYQTPELLEQRLKQVEINLSNEEHLGLKKIILACLRATILNPQNSSFAHDESYEEIRELFNKYIVIGWSGLSINNDA